VTATEVLKELEGYGNEQTKRTYMNHGAREPYFGVKVQDVKKIVKKIKKDHELALELYSSGNSDAMYMAGLIADETKMTKDDLNRWADEAYWYMISEFTVPWMASESGHGYEIAQEWIESKEERFAAAGWATLSYHASLKPDSELDLEAYSALLD
jgi:3-methyladenine DNA glycosylase AlkD